MMDYALVHWIPSY